MTGRGLPFLRLTAALSLTAAAVGALSAVATGAHLAGGTLDVLRNVAGLTGIGLLCAAVFGGGLAWAGLVGYMMVAVYALYTDWHGPAVTTPWLWPARPPHDLGAAICAGLVFAAGWWSSPCAEPATPRPSRVRRGQVDGNVGNALGLPKAYPLSGSSRARARAGLSLGGLHIWNVGRG